MSPLDLIPPPYNLIAKIGLPILALVGAYEVGSHNGTSAENTRLTAKYQPRLQHATDVLNTSTARIQAARAQALADDVTHARTIEQKQQEVTNNVSASYQSQLADLRARYDRMRAASATAQTAGGGGGASHEPGIPDSASRSDGATRQDGLSEQDAFIATAQALQLVKLQDWIRDQAAIDRTTQ